MNRTNLTLAEVGIVVCQDLRDAPYVDQRSIRRVAAWVHWSDSQSLNVAERALAASQKTIRSDRLISAIDSIETDDRRTAERLELARSRLSKLAGTGL
ncbi:MAG TPA: hypothetical protein VFE36_01365 [Candidatus Baltobacteraceae bacterium]|nr:hypothetical protein [Candidatus Baltobacteraceae bacterium]